MSQTRPTELEVDTYARAFVLDGKSKSDAWRITFPDSNAKPETVNTRAKQFHKLRPISVRIEELKAQAKAEFEKNFGATLKWKTEMLMKAANLGMACRIDDQGNEIPNNLGAVVSAIKEMNLMSGDHAAIKNEITGKDGAALKVEPVAWTIQPVKPVER